MVIIAKTPLRIPFAGGLTDLKRYAARFGAATCSVTINRYLYVVVKENAADLIDLRFRDVHERVRHADDLKHDLTREVIRFTGLAERPLEIHLLADLKGESGLGSSGALTVGLLHALHTLQGRNPSPEQLAAEASHIEIDILGGACGFHDPAICAFGGLNLIEYGENGVTSRRSDISPDCLQPFEDNLLVFYTAIHSQTNPSLHLLDSGMDGALETLHEMKGLAYAMYEALAGGDADEAGRVLHVNQECKMRLPGNFRSPFVDDVMQRAEENDLLVQIPGGKVGGFLLAYCPTEAHKESAREVYGSFQEVDLVFEGEGPTVAAV